LEEVSEIVFKSLTWLTFEEQQGKGFPLGFGGTRFAILSMEKISEGRGLMRNGRCGEDTLK